MCFNLTNVQSADKSSTNDTSSSADIDDEDRNKQTKVSFLIGGTHPTCLLRPLPASPNPPHP